jgi:hypothetical protein
MSVPKNLRDIRPSQNVDRYSFEGDAGPFVMMPAVLIRHTIGRRFLSITRSVETVLYLVGFAVLLFIAQYVGDFPIARLQDNVANNIAAFVILAMVYIVFAVFHSLRRWLRSLNGIYIHTFYSGTSVLEPFARLWLEVANQIVGGFLRFFGGKPPKRIFTDEIWFSRFVLEPVFCVIIAVVLIIFKLDWVAVWFFRSSRAMYLNSRDHFSMYRQEVLDMRDQVLDAAQLAPLIGVKFQDMSEPQIEVDLRKEERVLELPKKPTPPPLPKNNPSLSLDDMFEELDPGLKKMGEDD